MNRILVPIDGSPKSLIALEHIKTTFSPKAFEIVLMMVHENMMMITDKEAIRQIQEELDSQLEIIAKNLERYSVVRKTAIGKPGQRIVECAQEIGASMIVIMKSTKVNHSNTIGMTASYIIRHAGCNVLVVQERARNMKEEYRGMIYRNVESTVNLRGALSLKQSECLLPSVEGDVIYRIHVTRGRVRFLHRSYNPETREWDLPPENGDEEVTDISTGETMEIPVNAGNGDVIDRIRVVNRNMKTEAVFHYQIRKDDSNSAQEDLTEWKKFDKTSMFCYSEMKL